MTQSRTTALQPGQESEVLSQKKVNAKSLAHCTLPTSLQLLKSLSNRYKDGELGSRSQFLAQGLSSAGCATVGRPCTMCELQSYL